MLSMRECIAVSFLLHLLHYVSPFLNNCRKYKNTLA